MGVLDQYNEQSWLFPKLVKAVGLALLASVIGYSLYWLFFRNWREERQVEQFLQTVQQGAYAEAYEAWGCSVAEPCRFYSYEAFLEDWGPESPLGEVSRFRLGRSYTQPGGVIVEIHINGEKQPNLWVDDENRQISYFPY